MTASIGVSAATPGELDAKALLARADAAMYRAKRDGRTTAFGCGRTTPSGDGRRPERRPVQQRYRSHPSPRNLLTAVRTGGCSQRV